MHEEHLTFKAPQNRDAKIWRYMGLAEFLSILSRRELFFVKASKLTDPLEGTIAEYNDGARRSIYAEARSKFQSDADFERFLNMMPQVHRNHLSRLREYVLLNSWHLSDEDSPAMWGLYSRGKSGVAIQSTYARLSQTFAATQDVIWIGIVNYLDYKRDWMNEGIAYEAFVAKRKAFEFEKELRAITTLPLDHLYGPPVLTDADKERLAKSPQKQRTIDPSQLTEKGKYVSADLEKLVENVYVDPLAEDYIVDVVSSVLQKYGLDRKPIKSGLYAGV